MSRRTIEPEMVKWLDRAIAKRFGVVKGATPRALFIHAAKACEGIREVGGNNKGPLVELMQRTIGEAEGEFWCMSAVQTWLAYVEFKLGVISPIAASEHCLTVWRETPKVQRVTTTPLPGAIVIWQKGSTSNGHTGVYIKAVTRRCLFIEGNTEAGLSATGKVERDGGGIYLTRRSPRGTGDMKIRGYLKPFAVTK